MTTHELARDILLRRLAYLRQERGRRQVERDALAVQLSAFNSAIAASEAKEDDLIITLSTLFGVPSPIYEADKLGEVWSLD